MPNYDNVKPDGHKKVFLGWAVIIILPIGLLLLAVAFWNPITGGAGFLGSESHHQKIPEKVELADFQTELDKTLIGPLNAMIQNEYSKWIDEKVIKKFDDCRTIVHTTYGVELTANQFVQRPELNKIVEECAKILKIKRPRVFITSDPKIVSYAHTTNIADPIIIINSRLLRYFSSDEIRFIIGHEMGHIKCGHVRWHTIIQTLTDFIAKDTQLIEKAVFLAVSKWYQEGEYSADNAGLICLQDRKVSENALIRILLEVSETAIGPINVDEFLAQQTSSEFGLLAKFELLHYELESSHPFVPDRIQQLRAYELSPRYVKLIKTGK